MFAKSSLLIALALVASVANAQSQVRIYSWVDASGRHHHSDRPPAGSNIKPRQVNVSQPTPPTVTETAAVPQDKKGADEMISKQRAKDCEVARNNLNLLNDLNRQIVNQADPEAKPLDEGARTRARSLAESQVKDFCSAR
jgi:hypothetical protein